MKSGRCPKCESKNLADPRHFRAQGIGTKADMNIISCNDCRYSELYEMTAAEREPVKEKVGLMLLLIIIPTLLSIGITLYFLI